MSSSSPIASAGSQAARREAQTRLAQEDWEDTRDAVALREEWINRAVALGNQLLATPEDGQRRRDRLAAFVQEGLARLPEEACEVVVSAADAALLGPEWRRDVARATRRGELRVTAGALDGGCIVRTLDGRTSFDNSYSARAARFQSAWRSALARLYEAGDLHDNFAQAARGRDSCLPTYPPAVSYRFRAPSSGPISTATSCLER